jgi:hypothetical protein
MGCRAPLIGLMAASAITAGSRKFSFEHSKKFSTVYWLHCLWSAWNELR